MRRDKSLHEITKSGGIAASLEKKEGVLRREEISEWMGNVMGGGRGDLTLTQGKL